MIALLMKLFVTSTFVQTKAFVQKYFTDVHLMYFQVLFSDENGQCQKTFYPFCGVNEELKMFVQDMLAASKVLLFLLASFKCFLLYNCTKSIH